MQNSQVCSNKNRSKLNKEGTKSGTMEICQMFYVLSSKIQKDWRDKKINTYSDFKDKVDIKAGFFILSIFYFLKVHIHKN